MNRMRLHAVPAVVILSLAPVSHVFARHLTFDDRVKFQEALERVYYSHQVGASAEFEQVFPRALLERKVATYLKQTKALETLWKTPITPAMLQNEVERMVRQTKMPDRLQALFAALGQDSYLIQECLARPLLAERLARDLFARDPVIHAETRRRAEELRRSLVLGEFDPQTSHPNLSVVEIKLSESGDRDRTAPALTIPDAERGAIGLGLRLSVPAGAFRRLRERYALSPGGVLLSEDREGFVVSALLEHSAGRFRVAHLLVEKESWDSWWARVEADFDATVDGMTGSESRPETVIQTGSGWCIDDTWIGMVAQEGAPVPRYGHTSVWTGTHMIVWGGWDGQQFSLRSGGRYDPTTDSWTPTDMGFAPAARQDHTAVWTGTHMIVWGGWNNQIGNLDTGARYDPIANTWTPTSREGAPSPRLVHTAVWTGSSMIVWGGTGSPGVLNSGGRYQPASDSWEPMSTIRAPDGRVEHAAIWTGDEMVIWGGHPADIRQAFNTGGRYNPVMDSWTPTSTAGAPSGRANLASVWSGAVVVIWGGQPDTGSIGTGGRYDPVTDTWGDTTIAGAPTARVLDASVWAGSTMVIWGGWDVEHPIDGGRYDPVGNQWSQTSTSGAPAGRVGHRSVWTGSTMIVWGGFDRNTFVPYGDGGVYCACAATTYFRDGDSDGIGTVDMSLRACGQPEGYVSESGDCDDADSTAWSVPSEVRDIRFTSQAGVVWSEPLKPGATFVLYDALRSETPSDFLDAAVCVASDTPSMSMDDPSVPNVGSAFHYLVRAQNACPGGLGSLGATSDDTPRVGRVCP